MIDKAVNVLNLKFTYRYISLLRSACVNKLLHHGRRVALIVNNGTSNNASFAVVVEPVNVEAPLKFVASLNSSVGTLRIFKSVRALRVEQ